MTGDELSSLTKDKSTYYQNYVTVKSPPLEKQKMITAKAIMDQDFNHVDHHDDESQPNPLATLKTSTIDVIKSHQGVGNASAAVSSRNLTISSPENKLTQTIRSTVLSAKHQKSAKVRSDKPSGHVTAKKERPDKPSAKLKKLELE
jgi:hypothetical protein